MKMKILVTGGAGQLGNLICEELSMAGFDPIAIDKLMHSTYEALPAFGQTVEADIGDIERLRTLFRDNEFKAVIHCARLNKVEESIEKPDFYYENNLGGTLTLLKVMREMRVPILIYPHYEADPNTPLGKSFLMSDQVIRDSVQAYGFHATRMEAKSAKDYVATLRALLGIS